MQKKWKQLSTWCFVLALAIFLWTFYLYHFLTPEFTFTTVWQATPGKPLITLLFGIWGVMFGILTLIAYFIGERISGLESGLVCSTAF